MSVYVIGQEQNNDISVRYTFGRWMAVISSGTLTIPTEVYRNIHHVLYMNATIYEYTIISHGRCLTHPFPFIHILPLLLIARATKTIINCALITLHSPPVPSTGFKPEPFTLDAEQGRKPSAATTPGAYTCI